MRFKILLVLLLIPLVFGCSLHHKAYTPEEIKQHRADLLASVNLDDGVDIKEAEALGDLYFFSLVSGCGTPGEIYDKGDNWEIEMIVGYAAQKLKNNLIINKHSGQMSLEGWPTINNPIKEFADPDLRAPIIAGPIEE